MEKIRVLQVIGNLNIGGAENVAMNLYRYIDKEKFEFHYLVYGNDIGFYETEVKELGGKVIHMDLPSKNYISFIKRLESIMGINGPYDVVHSHTLFNSGLVLEAAKRVGVKKRIAHSHSIKNKTYTNKILQIYEIYMRYKIKKNATDYLACSLDAGNFLFGESQFKIKGDIFKNGVDVKKYCFNKELRNKVRKELNITDKFVIGHVGHLAPVKNQMFLIEIFNNLLESRDDVVLMLVGEGNDKIKILERIKNYNIDSSVIITGNRQDVNELLSAMDIFVFPSLYEGLGVAVIEAQTSGLPCVVSDKVPNEVLLTDIIEKVSLGETAQHWANIINNKSQNENRQYYYKIIEQKGYDVGSISGFLESFYTKGRYM